MISVQVLAIAYAVMGALLLYLLVATRRSLSFKIFTVVLISGLYVGTYMGLKELRGWPVNEALPERFRLHWAMINEPDKAQDAQGTIYLWIQTSAPNGELIDEPRAYHLPFNRKMAERVENALRQIGEGETVEGQFARAQPALQVKETDKQSKLNLELDPAKAAASRQEAGLQFAPLPRTGLPPKGA
ncbi:MAG: hypothetical protein ACI8PP_000816 [Candidatus Pseudothioglobus sp.]|jgi:hypothetical protein